VQRLLTQLMDGVSGDSDLDCDWRNLMFQVRAHIQAAASKGHLHVHAVLVAKHRS
jgi:hypothetical protein